MTSPAPPSADRHIWMAVAVKVAPRAPGVLLTVVSAALANPSATSDSLLMIADALEEASAEVSASGRTVLAAELHALADLPRMLAPHRVSPPFVADAPGESVPVPVAAAAKVPWIMRARGMFFFLRGKRHVIPACPDGDA